MKAIVRPAQLDDARALQRHCYPDHALEEVEDYLAWCLCQADRGRIVRLVVQVGGQAVGNAQLTVWGQEGEIGSLVVAEGYRRQGLATQLFAGLIAEARKRSLAALEIRVCECQPAILAFYERLGFHRVVQSGGGDTKNGLSHPGHVVQCRMLL